MGVSVGVGTGLISASVSQGSIGVGLGLLVAVEVCGSCFVFVKGVSLLLLPVPPLSDLDKLIQS